MGLVSELKAKAYRLLAKRNHTRLELSRKLLRVAPPEAVNQLIEDLTNEGYLDDLTAAWERCRFCRTRRRWSDLAIRADLRQRGIGANMVSSVLIRIAKTKTEEDCLKELLLRWEGAVKGKTGWDRVKKLFNRAAGRGFPPALIRSCLEAEFGKLTRQDQP